MKKNGFIEILKSEFARKKSKNASYSLRAFSRDLEIDPSNLSKLLNYQKDLGEDLKAKLAKRIGFSADEIQALNDGFAKTTDNDYAAHSLAIFQVIADWQHYAILECFKLKDFSPTIPAIAKILKLSEEDVRESFARLVQSGLLEKVGRAYRPTEESSSSTLSIATSKAHREQQKQILEGAIDALDNVAIEHRSQSSVTLAIDTQKLDEARALIKKFRRDLGRLLSDSQNLDEVYQLSVSLYPVTFNSRKKDGL